MTADQSVTVRGGTRVDVDDVLTVLAAADVIRGGGLPASDDEPTRARRRLTGPDAFFVVADSEGAGPVGVAAGMHARERAGAGPAIPGLCHIAMVAVHPDCWGRGIGRQLVSALLAEVRARGYDRAQLFTQADNGRAQRLYTDLGFRPTGQTGRSDAGEDIVHYLLAQLP